MLIFTVMLLAILEVLDSTIINVSLPAMMASLGANQSQITWVLTSYIVASAIILPITGYLSGRLGRQRFLIFCASGFMIASLACGMTSSLTTMIIFRVIQGLCGSSLIPMSQTILREHFPPEEQHKAMAIWGIGIISAPVFGPSLGGLITEVANWRWVFYVNLPFCLLALFLIPLVIPKTERIKERIDGIGLGLMIIAVASLQIFLDKGNEMDWLANQGLQALLALCLFCGTWLILRCKNHPEPVVNLNLYRDRYFHVSSLLMLLYCAAIFSFITLQPMLLEQAFGYSALTAGLTTGPLGIASAMAMALSTRLARLVKVKHLISMGLIIASIGLWRDSVISLDAARSYFIVSNLMIGFGMGLVMVPLSTQAFLGLEKHQVPSAAGLFSYARSLGTSIGVSLSSTLVSRLMQTGWQTQSAHIQANSTALTHWLHQQAFSTLNPTAVLRLTSTISQQATLLSFIDTFRVIAYLLLGLAVLAQALPSPHPSSDSDSDSDSDSLQNLNTLH